MCLHDLKIFMRNVDFYFYNQNVVRQLLINNLFRNNLNSFIIPRVFCIFLFFVVKDLVDFDDQRAFSYCYLIKFFFGRRSFFINYFSNFHLNVLYHNYTILSFIKAKDLYFSLFFFVNDIIPFISKNNLIIVEKEYKEITFTVTDLNLFTDKKSNLGLFYLKDFLNLKIKFISNSINFNSRYFLSLFKF